MATVRKNNKRFDNVVRNIVEDLSRSANVVIKENGRIDIIDMHPETLGLALGYWVHIEPERFDIDWLGRFMRDETAD